MSDCIRCHDAPSVDEEGFCGHCHWAVRTEAAEGIAAAQRYADNHSAFNQWLEAHSADAQGSTEREKPLHPQGGEKESPSRPTGSDAELGEASWTSPEE